jgi:hypothetical protein
MDSELEKSEGITQGRIWNKKSGSGCHDFRLN